MNLSEETLLKLVKRFLEFPYAQICKHSVASTLLSTMEEAGFPLPKELAEAVVFAHDNEAIAILDKLISEK